MHYNQNSTAADICVIKVVMDFMAMLVLLSFSFSGTWRSTLRLCHKTIKTSSEHPTG